MTWERKECVRCVCLGKKALHGYFGFEWFVSCVVNTPGEGMCSIEDFEVSLGRDALRRLSVQYGKIIPTG
jgi:hypothetical protein